jgi:hypothetical protein
MLNIKVVTLSLAVWAAFMFGICIIYGLLTPSSIKVHMLLEQILPGFKWLTWQGFVTGLIQIFLYGAFAGLVYVLIYNFMHRKLVRSS